MKQFPTPDFATYVSKVEKLVPEFQGRQYSFMEDAAYQALATSQPSQGMRIYWREILFRAHLAASTAIIRSLRWLSALIEFSARANALAFASVARGFMESAGDATTALLDIPESFAEIHAGIELALAGRLEESLMVAPTLEDDLIHFTHGRRLGKGEQAPDTHRARPIREYLEILERGKVPRIGDLYSQLCDITHPGASSVWMWVDKVSSEDYVVSIDSDQLVIEDIMTSFGDTLNRTIMFAFNPSIVTLAVLNYFSLPEVHTNPLIHWDLAAIKLWRDCHRHLAGLSPKVNG